MNTDHEKIEHDVKLWAKQVLGIESDALISAGNKISLAFVEAVNTLSRVKGKVVLTGLGKSGYVARKISSTFSSTGTSSVYLHPSEALHGDLGILGSLDGLVAIAQGGETEEVIKVVQYARRLGLPIIAITGASHSTLAKLAHLVIDSGIDVEACPLGLAPMASTTLVMSLGDALAACIMKLKGFTEENFASMHPGGSLGRKLSLVSEHTRPISEAALIKSEDNFHTVLEKVTSNNFGIGAVVDKSKRLIGAITDGDLRRAMLDFEAKVFEMKAEDFMTKNPRTTFNNALCLNALELMEKNKITSLFVLDPSSLPIPLGIVRLHDLLSAKIV